MDTAPTPDGPHPGTDSDTDRFITWYLDELGRRLRDVNTVPVRRYVDLLAETWRADRRVWIIGNGGSATTAAHHAVDLVKTAAVPGQRRLAAQAPANEIGLVTAVANDIGYAEAFAFVLQSYARHGDVLTALSCSGRSPSTVRACEWARAHGLTTVALTGCGGGTVAGLADLHIGVDSDNYGIIEDVHLAISHSVAQSLRNRIRRLTTVEVVEVVETVASG
ncbi:D-sedoheptulose-7-phosphate isomerase [Solwaraspora sp. WMMB335]|uniref:D-sedoheptulose-7-phosphate isomerase n=1 Tax=Solwaraspora sp. WMMB335 TaxID=3404118 RepID=UPI003B93FB2C